MIFSKTLERFRNNYLRGRVIFAMDLILSMLVSAVMIILSSFGVISSVTGAVLHNVGAFSVLINSSRLLSDRNK